ncbi:MAG: DUF4157 domain-containing protein [Anaerolineae bacterium]|uniref:eCIS core domain-containing protein n=1 Tax=Thermoflexus sp. TaxID=1969742 RepID=UPI0025E3FC0D|nr:DUF4157 domain-containing protein [Thermoflexus sp.]MCS7351486.1 DUF4157 domain-containing protein [Thermoflexus sp.]MDW8180943.1 DUF4157 domain-containing protein [Anaerolineae bacterium]
MIHYQGPIPDPARALLHDLAGPWLSEIDVERACLHVGTRLARAILRLMPDPIPGVDPAAVTLGRHIFMDPAYWPLDRPPGLLLLVHELVHVRQWREKGVLGFLRAYLGDYFSHPRRYFGVRLEHEAIKVTAAVEDQWRARGFPI